jgi:hypothetical protein
MLIKIYGERNSGTNFLNSIFERNFVKTHNTDIRGNVIYYWKHDVPDNSIKKLDEKVVEIFIFRNLESWLVSMFYNSYELERKDTFIDFLTTPQKIIPTNVLNFRHMQPINYDDEGKTIFEIRYYKYNKIMDYAKNNKNVVLVNLDYIQTKLNCYRFLNKLNRTYGINRPYFRVNVDKHTKTKQKIKNRSYDINAEDFKDIITAHKDNDIENHINKLTFEMY